MACCQLGEAAADRRPNAHDKSSEGATGPHEDSVPVEVENRVLILESVDCHPKSISLTGGDITVSFRLRTNAASSFSTVYTLESSAFRFANATGGSGQVLRIGERSASSVIHEFRDRLRVRAVEETWNPAMIGIRVELRERGQKPQTSVLHIPIFHGPIFHEPVAILPEGRRLELDTTRGLRSFGIGAEGVLSPDAPASGSSEPEVPELTRGGVDLASEAEPALEEVQFSAYAPRVVRPGAWHTLLAYCHLPSALAEIEKDSRAVLGAKKGGFRKSSAESLSLIAREAEITFVPELTGCRFNPPRTSVLWLEDWHRANFRFRSVTDQTPGMPLLGSVRCFVGPILVAEIPLQMRVLAEGDAGEVPDQWATASLYQSVFVSYSHKDSLLVDQLEQAYTVLGFKYLRDVRELRSGEEWNPALLRKIEEADLFQLCWSSRASLSPHVKEEWLHALAQGREGFIRPMYWEQPKPEIPPELAKLHFARFQVALNPAPAG